MTSAETSGVGVLVELRLRRQAMIIALMGFSYLILYADFSIISISLPAIGREFQAHAALVPLFVVGNALAIAGLLILGGKLVDRLGHRLVLVTGLSLYCVGAFIVATSHRIEIGIAGRILQGIGTAAASPATFSLINGFISPGTPRSRALSVYGITQGAALITGLIAGGWVVTNFGWRANYWILGTLTAVAALTAWAVVPARTVSRREPLDVPGAVIATIMLVLGINGISKIGEHGLTAIVPLTMIGGAIVAAGLFLLIERRASDPLLPRALFSYPQFLLCWCVLATFMGCVSGMLLLTQVASQQILGLSASLAGLAMIPFALAETVSGAVSPWFLARVQVKSIVLWAGALIVAGFLVLATTNQSSTYVTSIGLGTVLCAAGGYLFFITLLQRAMAEVTPHMQGTATAVMFTGMQIGVATGSSVTLLLVGAGRSAGLVHGVQTAFLVLATALATATAIAFARFRKSPA